MEPDSIPMTEISLADEEDLEDEEKKNLNNNASPGTVDLVRYDDALIAASRESGLHWAQSYTKLMNVSIKQAHHLVAAKGWTLLDAPAVESKVLLYDGGVNRDHFYKLKARGVFAVRPERLHYVIKDHDQDTRGRWDTEHLVSCKQLETFCITTEDKKSSENIDVVMSEHRLGIPFAWNRVCLGIQWSGFDPMTGVYKYVFRTTQHRLFRVPNEAIAVQGLVAVFIRVLDSQEEEECDFTLVMHVNIGDSFPQVIVDQWNMKEWLRKRVELYVHVAQNWDKYYTEEDNPKTHRK